MISGAARPWATLIGICVLAVAAYVGVAVLPKLQRADTAQKVTVARTGGVPNALFWIAEGKGYFKDEGLDVSYIDFDQGPPALTALREGKADITASGELPIVRAILDGDDIRILAEMESDFGINIIAWKDRAPTPADLAGKKIGVTKGTVNEFQLTSLLEAHGVAEGHVTLVDVSFAEAAELFLSRKVDAVSARQLTIVDLKRQLGDKAAVFSTEGIYTFRFLLVANQSLIERDPETVTDVVRALVRADEFAKTNPEEASAITARLTGTEQAVVDAVWDRYHFFVNLSQPIFVTLEDEARWLISRNQSKSKIVPNFLSYIYFDALERVKPEAVSVPR